MRARPKFIPQCTHIHSNATEDCDPPIAKFNDNLRTPVDICCSVRPSALPWTSGSQMGRSLLSSIRFETSTWPITRNDMIFLRRGDLSYRRGLISFPALFHVTKPIHTLGLLHRHDQTPVQGNRTAGCSSRLAPVPQPVENTLWVHRSSAPLGARPATCLVHWQGRWETVVTTHKFKLHRHSNAISPIFRDLNKVVDQVQSVLKYFQAFELDYSVPFLTAWASDIARDMDSYTFIQNGSMYNTCCYISVSNLFLEKTRNSRSSSSKAWGSTSATTSTTWIWWVLVMKPCSTPPKRT